MQDKVKSLLAKKAELQKTQAKQEAMLEFRKEELKTQLDALKAMGFDSLPAASARLKELEEEVTVQISEIERQL